MPDWPHRRRRPTNQGYSLGFLQHLRKCSLKLVVGRIARLWRTGFLPVHTSPFPLPPPLRGEGRAGKSLGFLVFIFGMSCAAGGFRRTLTLISQLNDPIAPATNRGFSFYFFGCLSFFLGLPPNLPHSRNCLRLYFFTVARPPIRANSVMVNSFFFGMGRC